MQRNRTRLVTIATAVAAMLTFLGALEAHDPKEKKSQRRWLAERVSAYGHGMLFDESMRRIDLEGASIAAMQEAILAEALGADDVTAALEEWGGVIWKAHELLRSRELEEHERVAVQAALNRAVLRKVDEELRHRYAWRNDAIASYYWNRHLELVRDLRLELRDLLEALGFFEVAYADTDYMTECRQHDVPVPPAWRQSGTAWEEQGPLTTNLLSPGGSAIVWTYSHPTLRGGCVALMRDSGQPGSPGGMICQSETTGRACFWDNIRRGTSPEAFLGWDGLTLDPTQLKDGSNLDFACTGCHRGDNVFLVSPDDPTWGKVLRGPLSGVRTGTFTTQVASGRYTPLTGQPPRPNWTNSMLAPGCAGACHETPSTPNDPPMPPNCARHPSDPTQPLDVSRCYGTP